MKGKTMAKNATPRDAQAKAAELDKKPKLVEIHVLQNHVPANMNRDDLGAPKTAMFGGVLRARISSQCLKRSVRWSGEHFRSVLADECSVRTGMLPTLVAEALKTSSLPEDDKPIIRQKAAEIAKRAKADEEGSSEDSAESSDDESAANGSEKADEKTQLIPLGPDDVAQLVRGVESLRNSHKELYAAYIGRAPASTKKEKEKVRKDAKKFLQELGVLQKAAFEKRPAIDVALYGRMATSDVFHNVDAAMSVAHAISTHQVVPDTDYWTGVDDERVQRKIAGAGLIQEAIFSPGATFYKYASLDWPALLVNLNNRELALKTVQCFLNAFFLETPTGKRHSHAHNNCPSGILVEIRDRNTPFNYANAFVKPVEPAKGTDIVLESARKLAFYVEQVEQTFAGKPRKGLWLWMPNAEREIVKIKGRETPQPKKDDQTRLDALVQAVLDELRAEE